MHKIIIKGGLGNQMFQYAYARKLILIDQEDVVFDLSFFNQTPGFSTTKRDFVLSNFNIIPITTNKNSSGSYFLKILNKILLKVKIVLDIHQEEYFQSEKYFKGVEEILRKEFTLKETQSPDFQVTQNKILSINNSVSVHIRRGDYVLDPKTNAVHGTCALDYYNKAIDYIKEKIESPTFFFFSDDIKWVKENLKIDNSVFVSCPQIKDYEEVILMSTCKHHIIANSTFSWWGAWLNKNQNKIVIAPKQWTNKKTSDELEILPPTWIQL